MAFNENGIAFLTIDDLIRLDQFLVDTNNLLIVKLHPMDILQNYGFPAFENLMIIKQKDFKEQLYPLLGACSYLLTDYSSVWVDYCILQRPIGFVMNDVGEYENTRGFTIDNIIDLLPGTTLNTFENILAFIETPNVIETDKSHLFNSYMDDHSSARVYKALIG